MSATTIETGLPQMKRHHDPTHVEDVLAPVHDLDLTERLARHFGSYTFYQFLMCMM